MTSKSTIFCVLKLLKRFMKLNWLISQQSDTIRMIFHFSLLELQDFEDLNTNSRLKMVFLVSLVTYGRLESVCTHFTTKISLFMVRLNCKLTVRQKITHWNLMRHVLSGWKGWFKEWLKNHGKIGSISIKYFKFWLQIDLCVIVCKIFLGIKWHKKWYRFCW